MRLSASEYLALQGLLTRFLFHASADARPLLAPLPANSAPAPAAEPQRRQPVTPAGSAAPPPPPLQASTPAGSLQPSPPPVHGAASRAIQAAQMLALHATPERTRDSHFQAERHLTPPVRRSTVQVARTVRKELLLAGGQGLAVSELIERLKVRYPGEHINVGTVRNLLSGRKDEFQRVGPAQWALASQVQVWAAAAALLDAEDGEKG